MWGIEENLDSLVRSEEAIALGTEVLDILQITNEIIKKRYVIVLSNYSRYCQQKMFQCAGKKSKLLK